MTDKEKRPTVIKVTVTDKEKSKDYQKGYEMAQGACDVIGKRIQSFAILCFIVSVLITLFQYMWKNVDSTDKSRWNRSGLRLHVDQATGREYLSTGDGALTPRLPADD